MYFDQWLVDPDFRCSPETSTRSAQHRIVVTSRPAPHQPRRSTAMRRTRHRRPHTTVRSVLGGLVSGITRILLDWLLHHLTH